VTLLTIIEARVFPSGLTKAKRKIDNSPTIIEARVFPSGLTKAKRKIGLSDNNRSWSIPFGAYKGQEEDRTALDNTRGWSIPFGVYKGQGEDRRILPIGLDSQSSEEG